MKPKDNPNLEPVPTGEKVPYDCPSGWYRTKGHPDTRIAGTCWVAESAFVYSHSQLHNNSKMFDNSEMFNDSQMFDNSQLYGDSRLYDYSQMYDNSLLFGHSQLHDNSQMFDDSRLHGHSQLHDNSQLHGHSRAGGNSQLYGHGRLSGESFVTNNAVLVGSLSSITVFDWVAVLREPGIVVVGCQAHPISTWLLPKSKEIPWDRFCTDAQRFAVQRVVAAFAALELTGLIWATDSKETPIRSQLCAKGAAW